MPERHSSGESSSSSSSNSGSSSSSSGGSSYHYNNYNNYNHGPESDDQRQMNLIWGVVGIVILIVIFIAISIGKAVKANEETADNANATATTEAITAKDLIEMHGALDSRLAAWKQVTDKNVHRVSYNDAGFSADSNTKEVDYGYCDDGYFYVYVLENSHPGGITLADTEGYAYTPGSSPEDCAPKDWQIYESDGVGDGWSFVTIWTRQATPYAVPTYLNTYEPPTATPDESSQF